MVIKASLNIWTKQSVYDGTKLVLVNMDNMDRWNGMGGGPLPA